MGVSRNSSTVAKSAGHRSRSHGSSRGFSRLKHLRRVVTVCILLVPGVVYAQEDAQILREDICSTCRIALSRVAVLGTDSGPPGMGADFVLGRSQATGRYWYASNVSSGEILVFERDGSFAGSVGRRGEGPGEFRWINQIIPSGQHVHVVDAANLRWTVLLHDLTVRSTQRLIRPPFESTVLYDSLLVVSMQVPTRELAGHPLHVFRLNRGLERSFGAPAAGYRADLGVTGLRHVSAAPGRGFWAAHITQYRLEKWDVEGSLLAAYRREADWFSPHHQGMKADPDTPPAPWLAAVHEDDAGLLWVLVLIADEEWYTGLVPSGDGTFWWAPDRTDFLDTMIEVVDPTTGSVLATYRWDYAARGFVDGSHLAVYRESPVGVPRVEIWRVALDRHFRR